MSSLLIRVRNSSERDTGTFWERKSEDLSLETSVQPQSAVSGDFQAGGSGAEKSVIGELSLVI